MKKVIYILLALLIPLALPAESFSSLWKKADDAQQKDLPKTQMQVLRQIAEKAETERAYGHLLKAQFMLATVTTQLSPDSLEMVKVRLADKAETARKPVLRAIYAAVLAQIYEEDENDQETAKTWRKRALENMDILASHKDVDYDPAIIVGTDSKTINNDMLHVIGFQVGEYGLLADYYKKHGNRPAAALCAYRHFKQTAKEDVLVAKKSKYLQTLDQLLSEYIDLKEAGEMAVEHYDYISRCSDVSVEDRINFINYALARWGAWPSINRLRNEQSDLQQPSFNISVGDYMMLPNTLRLLRINSIRNIQTLTINVYRINVTGQTTLNPDSRDDWQKLQRLIVPTPVQTIQRRYIGMAPWQESSDSISLSAMPVGVYLMEATTDNAQVAPQRTLLRVSDLYVMNEARPDNTTRFIVVNATDGKNIQGAHLELTWKRNGGDGDKTMTLITDKNGEALCQSELGVPNLVYAWTDDDKACGNFTVRNSYGRITATQQREKISVHTDRAIYRPGQQVHVASIVYSSDNDRQTSEAHSGRTVTFTLRGANGKQVAQAQATTDDYGTASTTFTLPTGGLTGRFTITAQSQSTAYAAIRVEQYKRPTFRISFQPYQEEYAPGDTVLLRGIAETYSGAPVQGAQVAYQVERNRATWWKAYSSAVSERTTLLIDTVQTQSDGTFIVRMPMELPEREQSRGSLYDIKVHALITDLAGETHEANAALPISLHSAFLSVDLPQRTQRDSLRQFTITRTNRAGEHIDGTVRYRIDNDDWLQAQANTTVLLEKKLPSGEHVIEAICQDDTLRQTFTVFSLSDKHAPTLTHDWFYVSDSQFPANGRPVYVQVGSTDEETHIYYSVFAGDKIIREGHEVFKDEVKTEKITYNKSMGEGIVVNLAWVHSGKLYTHTITITRPQPDNRLRLAWRTFRDKLLPGQQEEWTLEALTPEGKPAQAQLMATLFDKSLNQLQPHSWRFAVNYPSRTPRVRWSGGSTATKALYGFQPYKYLSVPAMQFSHLDSDMLQFSAPMLLTYNAGRPLRIRGVATAEAKGAVVMNKNAQLDTTRSTADALDTNDAETASADEETTTAMPQLRENLDETAFFYPALTTNEQGLISIRFTLPESLTTWHLISLAHDRDINYALLEADAVAQKTVMVQPNQLRFLRSGDLATVSTRIINITDADVKGQVRLQLINPETETVIIEQQQLFNAAAQQTASATFAINVSQLERRADGQTLFILRIVADGHGFSDGEQSYVPLLPAKERIIQTIPFSQNGAGEKTIDLKGLFPNHDSGNTLTVEYTNHPAWLVVQALPTIANPTDGNAISLASAIYANAIGEHILNANPEIAHTIDLWRQEQQAATLVSALEKNEELKTMVLSETPWMAAADRETAQKQQLSAFLDTNTISYRLQTFSQKLAALQLADGALPWWKGMNGSTHITMAVVKMLARLSAMTGTLDSQTQQVMGKAFSYLDKRIAVEVAKIKEQEKEKKPLLIPADWACDYLYASALTGRSRTADMRFLVSLLEKSPAQLTIYGKGAAAVILSQYGSTQRANDCLQSLKEYAVYQEDLGLYYDTRKAAYSWCSYKIPTQVMAIEALKLLTPNDRQTISDLQRWLLHEKRTTSWPSPLDATDAAYAFLTTADGKADMSLLATGNDATLAIDGRTLDMPQATAALGYQKTTLDATDGQTFTARKTSDGTAWGALYAQYWQTAADVDASAAGLAVHREVLDGNGKAIADNQTVTVGQKVTVRLTITADRDYDFVQVEDRRAACLEPAAGRSGYVAGYYIAPQDNATRYFFNRMAKGTHVIETDYYVERPGKYTSGTCAAQCAYSPEYSGREGGKKLVVEP